MDEAKQKRLEAAGYKVGTVAEFLGLTQAESELIEIKLAFTYALIDQRRKAICRSASLRSKSAPASRASPKWKRVIRMSRWI